MPSWKLSIFVNAVQLRHENGEGTFEEILATYPKLTDAEKKEILEAIKIILAVRMQTAKS